MPEVKQGKLVETNNNIQWTNWNQFAQTGLISSFSLVTIHMCDDKPNVWISVGLILQHGYWEKDPTRELKAACWWPEWNWQLNTSPLTIAGWSKEMWVRAMISLNSFLYIYIAILCVKGLKKYHCALNCRIIVFLPWSQWICSAWSSFIDIHRYILYTCTNIFTSYRRNMLSYYCVLHMLTEIDCGVRTIFIFLTMNLTYRTIQRDPVPELLSQQDTVHDFRQVEV